MIDRKYDATFSRWRGALPLNYIRALAYSESSLDPLEKASPSKGAAWGILQVYGGVLEDWNVAHPLEPMSADDRLDPDKCTRIGCWKLERIVTAFKKHPSANMRAGWSSREFAKLVTAGWNSGYSEAKGVGYMARWLEERGIEVTHDSVFQYAKQAGAHVELWLPEKDNKRRYQRLVVDRYFAEGGPDPLEAAVASVPFVGDLVLSGLGFARELAGGAMPTIADLGMPPELLAAAAIGAALLLFG